MKVLKITSLFVYLALISLTANNIGCLTTKKKTGTIGREQYSARNWVKSEDYQKYVLAKKKKTETVESQMAAEDKEYLEDTCTDCHDLKRVFLKRGSKSSWESLLNKEVHKEIGLDDEEKSQLLKILQHYLSNSQTRFPVRTPG